MKSSESEISRYSPGADFGPRCLVTGGAGFLGSALADELLRRGYEVSILDLHEPVIEGKFSIFTGDIRDRDMVLRACEGCSTVFHTAAVINLLGICRKAVKEEVQEINITGTENIISACQEHGVRRLIYTSTNTVCYSRRPVRDGDESRPYARRFLDIYAATKAEAEQAVLAADKRDGLRTIALRPAGLWGTGAECYMIRKFIGELLQGRLVASVGSGKSLADNTHLDNMVLAEMLAAEKLVTTPEIIGGKAYFITDEEPMNLMEWFKPIILGLGYSMPRFSLPAPIVYMAAFLMEIFHFLGGPPPLMTRLEVHNMTTSFIHKSARARQDLGYRPITGHDKGMDECVPFCRDIVNATKERISA